MARTEILSNGHKVRRFNYDPAVVMGWEYEIDRPWVSELNPIFNDLGFIVTADYGVNGNIPEVKGLIGPLQIARSEALKLIPYCTNVNRLSVQNNGGIHVNIERNSRIEAVADRVFDFMHNEDYFDFFWKLSQRSERKLKAYAPQYNQTSRQRWKTLNIRNGWERPNYTEKYSIIAGHKMNLYELRMFAAIPDAFLPALEFAHAIFHYHMDVDGIATPAVFREWLQGQARYRHIIEWINETCPSVM